MSFYGGFKVSVVWKPAVLPFSLMEAPLYAHTPHALSAGRYPLQSGLRTKDDANNYCLSLV